jgi:glycerol-3-phosphate O-acyltransferase
MRPLVSHVVVRPFVEAYRIVADVLAADEALTLTLNGGGGSAEITRRALGLGRQYVAQRRLRSAESVSVLLFQTAIQLAGNRGLLEPSADAAERADIAERADAAERGDIAERRAAFLAELRHLVRRLDQIEDLAIRRYIRDAASIRPAD